MRWKDNSVVPVASSKSAVAPIQKAKRWSVPEKNKHIAVDQPFVVQRYNPSMGGTDRMDQNVSCYWTAIRTRKWWWPIFLWKANLTVQNFWLIYRLEHRDMSELHFRAWIARTYLKQAEPRKSSGRTKVLAPNVLPNVRFDKMGHYVIPLGRQVEKCAKRCKSRPSQGCLKCGVGLYIKCFMPNHEK